MKNHPYIATTEKDLLEMLVEIGIKEINELYNSIPEHLRLSKELKIPSPIKKNKLPFSELELKDYMEALSNKNVNAKTHKYFLGAGCYNHDVPKIVDLFLTLPQFYTPYTPYKPETNQGTLQALYEYQTLMCQLTGMEVSNASLYDGSTAMVEASKMASRLTDRKEIIISKTIHPEYRQVFNTYFQYGDWKVTEIGIENGKTNLKELEEKIREQTAAVVLQSPNFFGIFEGMEQVSDMVHKKGALYINLVVEALALALVKPADFGADIVCGEAQSFGNHMSFGGPHLGFINCQNKHKSKLPGRIVTKTEDLEGKTAYMLWGAAREQHVSRDKATSNICSNHALNALASSIYLTWYGKNGLEELAELHNMRMAHYAYEKIRKVKGYKAVFPGNIFFNEFLVECPHDVYKLSKNLLGQNIVNGLDIGKFFPEYKNKILFCITEKTNKDDIDKLVSLLKYYNAAGVE